MLPHLYDDFANAEAMVVFRAGGGIFDKKYLHGVFQRRQRDIRKA